MRVKTKTTQTIICLKIVFQDARNIQAEGGNRLQAVGWCIANITFALISFMKLGYNGHIFLISFMRAYQRSNSHMISPQESKSKNEGYAPTSAWDLFNSMS